MAGTSGAPCPPCDMSFVRKSVILKTEFWKIVENLLENEKNMNFFDKICSDAGDFMDNIASA